LTPKYHSNMLRITLFTTILVLSAHIAGSGIASVGAVESTDTIKEQSVSGNASGDWVEKLPDPCYLSNVFCDWKFIAPVTKYIDTGTMSNGKQTHIGAIACPRSYKHGTKIEIEGKEYTCSDRTALRFDGRFDIFTDESYEEAMQFGKQNLIVMIK